MCRSAAVSSNRPPRTRSAGRRAIRRPPRPETPYPTPCHHSRFIFCYLCMAPFAGQSPFGEPEVAFQTIVVDVSPRCIATVLLNRPERGNAFDQVMVDELGEALAALASDPQARVIVLR